MQLTEVRINLCGQPGSRLKAFCSLTFDDAFVVRDVKLIDGNDGLFLAMPSRRLTEHCPKCREKNHLRARYCNLCGLRLQDDRHLKYRNGNGQHRLKLHADIAHPITGECRLEIEQRVLREFDLEMERSREPGYIPPSLDGEDFEFYDSPTLRKDDPAAPSENRRRGSHGREASEPVRESASRPPAVRVE